METTLRVLSNFSSMVVCFLPVTEIDSYLHEVVMEFYANLPDGEEGDNLAYSVFVRRNMYEFSLAIINQMFQLPNPSYPLDGVSEIQVPESMDEVAIALSNGKANSWKMLTYRMLSPELALLNKICCHNWSPTVNRSVLKPERMTLLYMVAKALPFNFGKLIFDEIWACSNAVANPSCTLRLVLPNLIDQMVRFQRIVRSDEGDTTSSAPLKFTMEVKPVPLLQSDSPTLEAALETLIASLTTMHVRLAGKPLSLNLHSVIF